MTWPVRSKRWPFQNDTRHKAIHIEGGTLMRLRIAALWGGITLLGLGVAGTTTLTAQETENPYTSRIDVRMGQRQFRAQCAGRSTCVAVF